jgi:FG-GAP-like repeat
MRGAASLLLCGLLGGAAGCADVDVDVDTSVTSEALSRPTFLPVSEAVSLNFEDPTVGPMVAVADLNNDGHPDLAIENTRNAVMVRLGDGAGGFGAETRFNLNLGTDRPNAVIAKDLDADGNVDLVTANEASLSVLMGNGDGTFGAATTRAILPNFFHGLGSVTAADLDGNGTLDLAASMNGGVGVLLGNGDGTFGARTDLICDGNIHHNSVTAGDFNLDGKIDLASAGSFTSSVYLFRGNGNGTFAACTATTVGLRPQSMTTGDFNQDGKPDLATANSWGISVTVLRGQGNGTFVTQNIPFLGLEFDMIFAGAAHVDGDSSLDLLVGHQFSLFVLSGSPSGTFTKTSTIALPGSSRFAVTGHFDQDPLPRTDLLVSTDAGDVALLRGDIGTAQCTINCTPFIAGSTRADGASVAAGANGGLTIGVPSLIKDGDVLYAFLTKNDDVGVIATPAGWTQLDHFVTSDGDDFTSGLWRRVVTSASSEPASYRFTHSDTSAEAMTGYIVAVRGANPAAPEDTAVARTFTLNSRFPSSPSVTTTSPSALVLLHEGVTGTAMAKVVVPFEATLVQSTQGANRNSGVSILLRDAPGRSGTRQWLNSGGASGAESHTRTIAVRAL